MSAFDAGAYAARLCDDAVAIFLLHGVVRTVQADGVRNYTRKHIVADEFEALLGALGTAGTAVSMDAVLAACRGTAMLPPRAYAVTFDDGFRNNLDVALPALERHGTPATVYVTTGFVDANGMSWIDRIERAVATAPSVAIPVPWRSVPLRGAAPSEKIALLDEIRTEVKQRRDVDAEALADAIAGRCVARPDDELDAKLDWEEVALLHAHPLVTVGGHTHTHPILAFLDEAGIEREVATSVRLLRERAGVKTRHYSYPEGMAHCFDERVVATLRRYGVVCCPTAIDGVNGANADPFALRRVAVV